MGNKSAYLFKVKYDAWTKVKLKINHDILTNNKYRFDLYIANIIHNNICDVISHTTYDTIKTNYGPD